MSLVVGSLRGSGDGGSGGVKPLNLQPFIWALADSRGQQNFVYSTTLPSPLSRGYLGRIETRSMRVRLDHRYMQSKSGDSIAQIRDRLTNDTPNDYGIKPSQVPPSICFNLYGTNTGNAYTPDKGTIDQYVAQMLADTAFILDWQAKQGHGTILCAEWPRGQTEAPNAALLTPDAQEVMYRFSDALRQISRPNVYVINVLPRTIDNSKVDYTPLPNMLNGDFLHPNLGISEVVTQAAWDIPRLLGLPEIAFSTAGALNSNPDLLTLGGTLGSNAVAGSDVPLGYTLSCSAGMTVAGKKVQIRIRGKLRTAYRMIVTGTPAAANTNAILRQSGLIGTITAGDTLEGWEEIYVGPGAQNFSSPGVMIDTGVSATRLHSGLSITGDTIMPPDVHQPYYGVQRTNKGAFPVLPASLSFQFGAHFTAASVPTSVTLYILSAKMGKVNA